jgi:protein O-mannosyl-transferase
MAGVLWALRVLWCRRSAAGPGESAAADCRVHVAGFVLLALVFLLPGNSLLPRLDVANDRHLYLPLLCLLGAAAIAVQAAWQKLQAPYAGAVLLASLFLLLGGATFLRNLDYLDERALWESTVTQSPGKSRPWNNLGMACQRAGDVDCAAEAYVQAIRLDPENLRARTNLYFLRQSP